jgi:ZIP family zinc transporter
MPTLQKIIIFAGFAGATVFIGGLFSLWFNHHLKEGALKTEINHLLVSFGGGIILSALALVLVPDGMEITGTGLMAVLFLAGAGVFLLIDRALAKKGGQMGQLLAMLMDLIPESLALGAVFAADPKSGTLLAIFIGLQNLPESFNSFRDLVQSGMASKKALIILFFLSFAGIAAAMIGHFFLRDLPQFTSGLMLFASGGILYLVFQDIAPQGKLKQHWVPALGACAGFLIGMVGEKLIG